MLDCTKLNSFLFRRTPDFDQELQRDRFPMTDGYLGIYPMAPWPSFTGTEHTYDLVHVTMPNDDGCWDTMDATSSTNGDCMKQAICNPTRYEIGWGTTRRTYSKYFRKYTTKPLCFDQLRHMERVKDQLGLIVSGLKKVPPMINSDFLRFIGLKQADFIHICGTSFTDVTVSDSIFTNNCMRLNLSSTSNLPTSKLTMQYLNHFTGQLMYNGYFDRQFPEGMVDGLPGKFMCMTDFNSQQEITNANPALTQMYNAADFAKGGKFFSYGVMSGCGDFMFRIDPTPLRYTSIGSGVLQRLMPYENVSATTGKKPRFDTDYEKAPYQLSHVYCPGARNVFSGSMEQVNPEMPYVARDLMGKWAWKTPDFFSYRDPETGSTCNIQNDEHNWGYFLGNFELGSQTVHPECEFWILHLRETTPVADVPRVQTITWPTTDGSAYQTLTPYNNGCDTTDQV